ncbi:hypothetical protein C4D60_Mb04t15140 [Musa balbisiana]|uniref:Uncharacterized protein n=1 Tax=Musa balbisiana TaxID=52838 RepID=A0A4S8KC68_MUSBA|nr:hypothetical protein C4D60_Mb04t15140 [Musa balbisiana]
MLLPLLGCDEEKAFSTVIVGFLFGSGDMNILANEGPMEESLLTRCYSFQVCLRIGSKNEVGRPDS